MKSNNKIGGVAQKIISTVFFLVTFICLLYFYSKVKYLPLFLAAIIVVMPVAVNFFLHLFSCKFSTKKPEKKVFEEGTKKAKKFFLNFLYILKKGLYGILCAYNKAHKVLQIVFVLGAFIACQIIFGMML
ncbi:MAG: hypothetical protein E7678_04530, partial [Ruminococcaceae bacterium]|nr:hypothetical protein [Oscillospiraceae bacterium]